MDLLELLKNMVENLNISEVDENTQTIEEIKTIQKGKELIDEAIKLEDKESRIVGAILLKYLYNKLIEKSNKGML